MTISDFPRTIDRAIAGALNPGERVIWTGHCLSQLGKQKKTGPGPDWSPGSCLFVIIVQFVLFLAVLAWTGTGLGLLAIFPLTIGLGRVQRRLLHSPDSKLYCRKEMAYVLTNQRVFLLRNCNRASPLQSVPLQFIDVVRVEGHRSDGCGNVQFLHWDAIKRCWTFPMRFRMVQRPGLVVKLAREAVDQANANQGREAVS